MKKADLHVHTHFSDGTFSPEEVVKYASKIGLSCIAICDHDIIEAIDPAMRAGEKFGVEIIPGVEMTAEKNGCEIHILGFFIDWKNPAFRERLNRLCEQRRRRIYDMVDKLREYKVNLSVEDVLKIGGEGSIGRLHLAQALYEKGHVKSVPEAFRRYIGDGGPCYVAKINLSPESAIDEITKAGGIPVLAHPGVMGRNDYIPSYIKHGLRGIEVYYGEHSPRTVKYYEKIAKENNLLLTGGSDCHGAGKGRVLMGSMTVPYELVQKLKDANR